MDIELRSFRIWEREEEQDEGSSDEFQSVDHDDLSWGDHELSWDDDLDFVTPPKDGWKDCNDKELQEFGEILGSESQDEIDRRKEKGNKVKSV